MSMFERTERGLLARWWWTVDRPMLAGIGLLVLSGMVFVFASSPPVAERLGLPHLHFAGRHALYLVPAAVLLLGSSLLSPVGVRRLAWALLGLSLLMMVMTLLVGPEIKGAQRWLPLGFVVLQPGEFAKPAMVVITAALLARAQGIGNALPAILLGALVAVLLLAQPDVSMALVVVALLGMQLFLAGLPWLLVIALIGLGAVGSLADVPHVPARRRAHRPLHRPGLGRSLPGRPRDEGDQERCLVRQRPRRGHGQIRAARCAQRLRVRGRGRGVRPGGMPGAARAVRLRAAARPRPHAAGRRPLRAARSRGPAGPLRAADDHQSGRQREPACRRPA